MNAVHIGREQTAAIRESFGLRLASARKTAGLNQTELAGLMRVAGFDDWKQHITSRVERGARCATKDEIAALEQILDVKLRDEDMTLAELRAIINETSRDLTVALARILNILDIGEPRP